MPTMPSIEVDVCASVGLVRPGDKLVVAVHQRIDMAGVARIKGYIEAQLPGVEVVPVQADALVVYRP